MNDMAIAQRLAAIAAELCRLTELREELLTEARTIVQPGGPGPVFVTGLASSPERLAGPKVLSDGTVVRRLDPTSLRARVLHLLCSAKVRATKQELAHELREPEARTHYAIVELKAKKYVAKVGTKGTNTPIWAATTLGRE